MKYNDLTGYTLDKAHAVLMDSGIADLTYRLVTQPRESGDKRFDETWRVIYTTAIDGRSMIVTICRPYAKGVVK